MDKMFVVVGDWFIDEYWFISRHHSEVSSHTGPLHYRIVSDLEDPVRDLCGAGLVARVLYELRRYRLDGFGDTVNHVARQLENRRGELEDGEVGEKDERTLILIREQVAIVKEHISRIVELKKNMSNREASLQHIAIVNAARQQCQANGEILAVNENWDNRNKDYQIVGFGRWHPDDDNEDDTQNIILHFLHGHCRANAQALRAPFALKLQSCGSHVDARIQNLEPPRSKHATVRCIRTYNFVSGHFEQLSRIDWELAPPRDQSTEGEIDETFVPEINIVVSEAFNTLAPTEAAPAVIIEDHKKGVVNHKLIKEIKNIKALKANTKWFVRTKDSRIQGKHKSDWPDWLRLIDRIELLAIGPEIACRAYPINGLLTAAGRLAEHAFALIDAVIDRRCGTTGSERIVRHVVLTSDKLEVVALLGDWCFIAPAPAGIKNIELEKINWTTALFAGLAYEMMMSPEDLEANPEKAKDLLERAIKHAHAHSGVKIPGLLRSSTEAGCIDIFADRALNIGMPGTVVRRICDWPNMQKDWRQASTGSGVIHDDGAPLFSWHKPWLRRRPSVGRPTPRLEIWRASTDLPGYIALIDEKREAVRRMWAKIHRFTLRKDIKNSLSILLEADPAVGKSYLAKTLAESVDCTFLYHDVSQLIHREELLDLFDSIATSQAASSRPVFVFVDEINATLDGSPVYGAFLSPLEAGNYMRRGRRFELKPAIWMFAGTPVPGESEETGNAPMEKRQDFESRLTMLERIDYASMLKETDDRVRLQNQVRLEQVYLGAKMINDAFNDVHWIDRDLLDLFRVLPPDTAPARRIKRLAASLENVQYGRVHKGNCTSQEWQEVLDGKRDAWARPDAAEAAEYVEIDLS